MKKILFYLLLISSLTANEYQLPLEVTDPVCGVILTPINAICGEINFTADSLSSLTGDFDITTQAGGVFKFNDNAFQAGQDSSNYLETGHGGSNSFVNSVGAGNMDFRFCGVNKATFTSFGHLHLLTDVDQKHNLKIKTADNLNDSGLAWENSGGNFSQTIFRTDVGSNRSDLVFAIGSNACIDLLTNSFLIHGSAAEEGKLELLDSFQISFGCPSINDVWSATDTCGNGTWQAPSGGGWVDDGTTVRLGTSTDDVVIGANTGDGAPLELVGDTPGTVGGFASGAFQIRSPSCGVNANAVITGHNSNGGNKQLWYFGSAASGNDNITILNRQNAELQLGTNNTTRVTVQAAGDVILENQIQIKGGTPGVSKVLTSDANGLATWEDPVFAQLSDSVDQKPAVTTPVVITFDTNDEIRGITHSVTTATEDIIIDIDGTYTIIAQPQVEKTSGGGTAFFHMWARIGLADGGTTVSVSVANPSVITTTAAHGLTNGQTVEITNTATTPSINAQHVITVTGASTFTIPVNVTAVTDGTGDWRRVLDINDDVANSNVELNLTGAMDSSVIPLIFTTDLTKGTKINIMQSIEATGVGVGLVSSAPSGEPAIPSIIFAIHKN